MGAMSVWKTLVSHYEVRGSRTIINLPDDYQIFIWSDLEGGIGHSTILHFVEDYGYKEVFKCRELPIESETQLLSRIKLLSVFS
jgi:hypothetical protein